eukprot:gnl/TRDRNA2_/TRDRNA2_219270_c0_seq1.p1 gnl/TRDRNA2_/TRDRNA2_219270_c0~~gnl/TRDRNA2_/TRDRNA2_219270_c0_seq1.p1  ORF type:complete len:101 (-),score=7.25 gnl/TRDRNA2_/TRDRNA2_219270_c0_seq1:58-360(-)
MDIFFQGCQSTIITGLYLLGDRTTLRPMAAHPTRHSVHGHSPVGMVCGQRAADQGRWSDDAAKDTRPCPSTSQTGGPHLGTSVIAWVRAASPMNKEDIAE